MIRNLKYEKLKKRTRLRKKKSEKLERTDKLQKKIRETEKKSTFWNMYEHMELEQQNFSSAK